MKTSKFYQYKNFESDQKSKISDKNKFFCLLISKMKFLSTIKNLKVFEDSEKV